MPAYTPDGTVRPAVRWTAGLTHRRAYRQGRCGAIRVSAGTRTRMPTTGRVVYNGVCNEMYNVKNTTLRRYIPCF